VNYNVIRFDDPLMQHALFRHLHDPYLMLKRGNCGIDLSFIVLQVVPGPIRFRFRFRSRSTNSARPVVLTPTSQLSSALSLW
jgi:hypothetical protein